MPTYYKATKMVSPFWRFIQLTSLILVQTVYLMSLLKAGGDSTYTLCPRGHEHTLHLHPLPTWGTSTHWVPGIILTTFSSEGSQYQFHRGKVTVRLEQHGQLCLEHKSPLRRRKNIRDRTPQSSRAFQYQYPTNTHPA